MKWVRANFWGPFTVLLVLIGASEVPDQVAKWRRILSILPDWAAFTMADFMVSFLAVAYAICAVIAVLFAARVFISIGLALPQISAAGVLWVKRSVGMSEWISKDLALDIIKQSEFMALRDGGPAGGFQVDVTRALGLFSQPKKHSIMQNRFRHQILEKFAQNVDGAVQGGKYNAELLQRWLDKLADAEVQHEMGSIPDVRM